MSADNKLVIREDENGEYDLSENWDEGGVIQSLGHFKGLRKAMVAAEKYQRENEVEYGVSFVPFPREPNIL